MILVPRLRGTIAPPERRLAGDVLHQIGAFHLRNRASFLDQLCWIDLARRDDAAHHARRPEHARQRAGIDVSNGHDAVTGQIVAQSPVCTVITGERRRLAHDETGHMRCLRFGVARSDTVVADLRRRHRDDLPGVGGVSQDFLVAGHAGVEDNLA